MSKKVHVVKNFVAGIARTRCGLYLDAGEVTAFYSESDCRKCTRRKSV